MATEVGAQPIKVWDFVTGLRLEIAPLMTREFILAVSPSGTAVALPKVPQEDRPITEIYRFATNGRLGGRPGQFLDTAYLGSLDSNLYALNINTGRLEWRYTAGAPVVRRPVALAGRRGEAHARRSSRLIHQARSTQSAQPAAATTTTAATTGGR